MGRGLPVQAMDEWFCGSGMEAGFEYQRQAWGYSTTGQSYGATCVPASIDE